MNMKAETIEGARAMSRPSDAPQCEADVTGVQPYRRGIPPRCLRRSQYRLDGKCYCAFHAGQIALDHILRKDGTA